MLSLPMAVMLTLLPAPGLNADLALGYQGETGVEAKCLLNAGLTAELFNLLTLDCTAEFSFIEHPGPAGFALTGGLKLPGFLSPRMDAGFQHQRWTGWNTSENRLFGLVQVEPLSRLEMGLGICRRLPAPGMNEWNIIYRFGWRLLETPKFGLTARLTNLDRLEILNPQQFPISLDGAYRFTPRWQLVGRARLAFNGFSTGLIYPSALRAEIGVKYGK
ncbi:MAG: hypothetical protein ABIK51_00025 [candidate division WOR-3 bacterium]